MNPVAILLYRIGKDGQTQLGLSTSSKLLRKSRPDAPIEVPGIQIIPEFLSDLGTFDHADGYLAVWGYNATDAGESDQVKWVNADDGFQITDPYFFGATARLYKKMRDWQAETHAIVGAQNLTK